MENTNKDLFTLELNGKCYGKGSMKYMMELINDYANVMNMYGNNETTFTIKRNHYNKKDN